MTRLAIISDVHADVHALSDALVQIRRLECEHIVCAGDLLDWGLFPQETIDLIRERRIPCVRGNHDRWAVGRGRADEPSGDSTGDAYDASGWELDERTVRFLAALPSAWDAVIDGVRVAVWHASPGSDVEGIYPDEATETELRRHLDEAGADVLLVGHTHIPFRIELADGKCIANPGALLRHPAQPMGEEAVEPESGSRDRVTTPGGGTFAVLELPSKVFRVLRASDGTEVSFTSTRWPRS